MEIEEANIIFEDWKDYAEINDKLMKFFMFTGIPESFLPHSKEILEDALNIIAKAYFDAGNYTSSESIKTTIAFLLYYKSDEEAFDGITKSTILNNPKIKESVLNNLKMSRESWREFKKSIK